MIPIRNVLFFVGSVLCAPLGDAFGHGIDTKLGIQLSTKAEELPTLKLPYGTYRAKSYDKKNDVRFAYPFPAEGLETSIATQAAGD
jgi:hypothetical protein